jgi:hypothetical protein
VIITHKSIPIPVYMAPLFSKQMRAMLWSRQIFQTAQMQIPSFSSAPHNLFTAIDSQENLSDKSINDITKIMFDFVK